MSFITFGLCKKLDTTVIVRTGMIIAIVGQIVGILAPTSLSVQMVSAVIRSIGWGLLAALIHSMVGDAIEYGHWRTGHKAPGTSCAAQGVGNKLGVLIGSGVTTLILGNSAMTALQLRRLRPRSTPSRECTCTCRWRLPL